MRRLSLFLVIALGAGCSVGPKYKRPDVPTPPAFRGPDDAAAASAKDAPAPESLGDLQWFTQFEDPTLVELVRIALKDNFDVQRAAARVAQAQAMVGSARAQELPEIDGTGSAGRQRSATSPLFPGFESNSSQLGLSSAWQLDFWGRYRKSTEAARAGLAESEWGRKAVVASLVSNLATAYFQLRELDLELEISQRALAARRESLELTRTLDQHGAASLLDVRQSEKLVELAARRVPDLERRIAAQENAISILLGRNPGEVPRGQSLESAAKAPAVPPGLPSALLERRPDLRQAELRLVAANARIGAAKALYFPQLSLTGAAGFQAYSLGGLFDSKVFNVGAGMTTPIFDFGRIRSGVRLTEAQQQELILAYRQAVQQAFREVSDALSAVRKNREYRERQQALRVAAGEAARLAGLRFRGGATGYLEVLTSENDLLDAELELASARLNERLAAVQLYTALGGGWQQ